MDFELTCPHCKKEIVIPVEVESPSDYYFENTCPECNKPIKTFTKNGKEFDLDIAIMGEVSENIVSRAEYFQDMRMDR